MGEKPTAAEDAAAKSGGGGKETEAQAAQADIVSRDRGIGSPSGRLGHEAAHTAQQQSGRAADGSDILPDTDQDQAGIAIGDPGVNGNLAGSGAADPAVPMEASNLNSSKSNVARTTNLNSSRSNIAREQGDPSGSGDVPAEPTEAANLNLSKSNID